MALMTAARPARIGLATLPTPLAAAPRLPQAPRAGSLCADGADMVFWPTGGLLDAVAVAAGARP